MEPTQVGFAGCARRIMSSSKRSALFSTSSIIWAGVSLTEKRRISLSSKIWWLTPSSTSRGVRRARKYSSSRWPTSTTRLFASSARANSTTSNFFPGRGIRKPPTFVSGLSPHTYKYAPIRKGRGLNAFPFVSAHCLCSVGERPQKYNDLPLLPTMEAGLPHQNCP